VSDVAAKIWRMFRFEVRRGHTFDVRSSVALNPQRSPQRSAFAFASNITRSGKITHSNARGARRRAARKSRARVFGQHGVNVLQTRTEEHSTLHWATPYSRREPVAPYAYLRRRPTFDGEFLRQRLLKKSTNFTDGRILKFDWLRDEVHSIASSQHHLSYRGRPWSSGNVAAAFCTAGGKSEKSCTWRTSITSFSEAGQRDAHSMASSLDLI